MRPSNGWLDSEDVTVSKGLEDLGFGKLALEHMNRRLKAYMSVGESRYQTPWSLPRSSIGDIGRISYFPKANQRNTYQSEWGSTGLRRTASRTHDSVDGVEDRLQEIKQENEVFRMLNGDFDSRVQRAMHRASRRNSASPDITVHEPDLRSDRSAKQHSHQHLCNQGTLSHKSCQVGESRYEHRSDHHNRSNYAGGDPDEMDRVYIDQGIQAQPSVSNVFAEARDLRHHSSVQEKDRLLKKLEKEQESHLKEKEDLLAIIENQKHLLEHFKNIRPANPDTSTRLFRLQEPNPFQQSLDQRGTAQFRAATSSSRMSNDGEMVVNHRTTSARGLQSQFPERPIPLMTSDQTLGHLDDQIRLNVPQLKVPETSFRTHSQLQTAGSGSIKEGTLKVPSQSAIRTTPKEKSAKKRTRIEGDKVIAIGGPKDVARPHSSSKISFSQSRSRSKKQTPSPSPPLPPKGDSARTGPQKFERLKKLRKHLLAQQRTASKGKSQEQSKSLKSKQKAAGVRDPSKSKSPMAHRPKPAAGRGREDRKTAEIKNSRQRPSASSVDTILKHTEKRVSPKLVPRANDRTTKHSQTVRLPQSNLFASGVMNTPGVMAAHGLDSFDKGLLAYCFAKKQVMPEYKKKVDVFVDRLSDYLRTRALRPSASEVLKDGNSERPPSNRTELTNFVKAVTGVEIPRPRSRSTKSRSVSPAPGRGVSSHTRTVNPLQRLADSRKQKPPVRN